MNEGLIPSRYAKALFEFAGENNADKRVYDMMHTLAGSFAAQPSLQQVMANPFVDNADKVKLLTTAAGAGADDKVYARFLQLLVDNNRLAAMRDIALAYMKIYRREHKIYLVNVTLPHPSHPQRRRDSKSSSSVISTVAQWSITIVSTPTSSEVL